MSAILGTLVDARFRRWWIAGGWGFVALVVYLSLNTHPIDAGRIDDVKVGHFVAYCWLMLWFAQAYRTWRNRLCMAGFLLVLGVSLEFLQGMTTYRSFAYSDMADNGLGIFAGFILALTPLSRTAAMIEAWVGPARRGA